MITRLEIENFRGFRRLVVDDLGRVNLIVGKNDCGKTSLAAAVLAATSMNGLDTVASGLTNDLTERPDPADFEARWRHLFRDGDATTGFTVHLTVSSGETSSVQVKQAPERPVRDEGWPLIIIRSKPDGSMTENPLSRQSGTGELMLYGTWNGPTTLWVAPTATLGAGFRTHLERIKITGGDNAVIAGLAGWHSDVVGIELIGTNVLVRLRGRPRLLPVRVLGEGARRIVDLAVSLGAESGAVVGIDEVDAGFHHSVLASFWTWLRTLVVSRDHQVFATTHSDECVLAACRAFKDAGDDGLRVIRIDRTADGGHNAVVFTMDRALEMLENEAEIR